MQHIVIDPRGALPSAIQAFVVPDDPQAIALAVESLIARLDEMDGDPDFELNGDESDFDGEEGDQSFPEWHTLTRQARLAKHPVGYAALEDTEDDDPAGGNVDDGPHDPEQDRCAAGDDMVLSGPVVFITASDERWSHHCIGADEDNEIEVWAHWLDHPPELHIGLRAGWNTPAPGNDQ